jgi:ABC-type antimicrobial peptide transport system permease subunit
MKKFLKILGIIVGVIVVIIVIAMIFTSGLTKATNSLFSDIKAGNIQAAYTQTAQEFQTSTTLDQFKTFLQQSNLANIKNTTRNERSVTNNQGKLV